MVKYVYNEELEVFKRVDNRGVPLKFNISEARQIESMLRLGMKSPTIYKKIDFVNDVSQTSLRTFISNLENGNIDLSGDYPIPVRSFEELDWEARISKIERDLDDMRERYCTCECAKKESLSERVRKWLMA